MWLPHEIGRRPRWQLREAKHRAQDGICTVGRNELDVEEPFLRYRSFLPFTGNVLRAQEFFAASVWERDEACGSMTSGSSSAQLRRCGLRNHRA